MYKNLSKPHKNLRGVARQCCVREILFMEEIEHGWSPGNWLAVMVWEKKS